MFPSLRRASCAGIATVLWIWLFPIAVGAHTSLLQTDPQPNSTINHTPDVITMRFDQNLQPGFNKVTVYDATKRPIKTENNPTSANDPTALMIAMPQIPTGVYSVIWQVLSEDGHVVRGAFVFTVALPGDPVPAPVADLPDLVGASSSNRPPLLAVVLRGLRYGGIAALVGGIGIFLLCLSPALAILPEEERVRLRRTMDGRLQRWLFIALGIALMAHVFALIVQTATVNNTSLGAALRLDQITDLVKNTTFGAVWRIVGIALLALGEWIVLLPLLNRLPLPPRGRLGITANPVRTQSATAETAVAEPAPLWGWWIALVAGFGLLLVIVFGGHSIDVNVHPALAIAADWLHLAAMSLWFGGLILVAGLVPVLLQNLSAPERSRVIAAVIGRFSSLALFSMIALAVSGTYAVTVHTTRATIGTTTYGLVIIGKVALVLCIVILAALNRFTLRRWTAGTDDARAARARVFLQRGMAAEIVLGVAVIGLTGLLTQLAPANTQGTSSTSLVAIPSAPAEAVVAQPVLEADNVKALLTVETKGTDDTFDARVTDSAGNLRTDVQKVFLWLNSGDKDVGTITLTMTPADDGHYRVTGQWFAIGQNWLARVVVRRKDVAEDVKLPFAIQPRPTAYPEESVPPTPFLWPRLLPAARIGIVLLALGMILLAGTLAVRLRRMAWRRAAWSGAAALVLSGLIIAGWYSVPTTPLTGRANPQPATADVLAQGQALFAQNCAVCHGPNGAGTGKPGTALPSSIAQRYTDGDLYWLISNGLPGKGMPAQSSRLSPAERWQVVRYLRSIQSQTASTNPAR
jgi:copper transport protein